MNSNLIVNTNTRGNALAALNTEVRAGLLSYFAVEPQSRDKGLRR